MYKKWLFRSVGILFFLLGAIFLSKQQIQNYALKQTTKQYDLSSITKEDIQKNEQKKTTYDFEQVESISTAAVAQSQLNKKKDNLPVVASIAIPSVGVRLPIFKGLNNEGLFYGAGTMKEDQQLGRGNYALASHSTDQEELLFTPIEHVSVGEKMYVTDLTHVYTYTVSLVKIIDPSEVEVIEDVPGQELLTLITCEDIYATKRVFVQGVLTSVTPIDDMTEDAVNAFELPVKSY